VLVHDLVTEGKWLASFDSYECIMGDITKEHHTSGGRPIMIRATASPLE
jgi:hypothetical protein